MKNLNSWRFNAKTGLAALETNSYLKTKNKSEYIGKDK